ncbi:sulfurtransferase [Brevirhabdus pacifica]|uniref:Sulfurtransferase n=1 Tax=Brevirhabdus pacifica TaxID=1267768 RepID=A0A1U7DJE6_9RHOB|nr:rhodanese-like domain-containing protein [Brevirhabdus pacifica]APX90045.1 sulfurtransferase [Brevirhabdus pacifica]OWU75362.1 sulfurtransferase [Loktanella sp. 22II-4b]PJJ82705.1 rhodanese-related sulfurtransferase [Brevirhabdus pacifica]
MKTDKLDNGTLETWTIDEVEQAVKDEKIVLIDVRTPAEYMMEHIEGALLMPMSFFKPGALPTQDGKQIVFHCGSGVRSEKVAKGFLEAGNDKVAHMEGGFGAWKKAEKCYVGTDMATGAPKRFNNK